MDGSPWDVEAAAHFRNVNITMRMNPWMLPPHSFVTKDGEGKKSSATWKLFQLFMHFSVGSTLNVKSLFSSSKRFI